MVKNNIFVKNSAKQETELFVYGEIVNEKYWDSDVDAREVRDVIEKIESGSTLNMYVNSPGGSVFTASAMVSMLERAKEKGVTINAYVDGLAASAASFLIMAADNVIVYQNSMMMIHKPITYAYGNSAEMNEVAERLDIIEKSVMLPLYARKSKVPEEEIKEMIAKETWMTAEEISKIFNVTISENKAQVAAYADKNLLSRYKSTPKALLEKEKISYEEYEEVFESLKKGN